MKFRLRGFTENTLKKYSNVKQNPLLAISKKNQEELGIVAGDILISDVAVQLIDGKDDKFVGMTKTLRESLGLDIGEEIEIEKSDGELTVKK